MPVRQSFCFEQEAQSVHSVFEISLRRRGAALLQPEQVVLYLFGIELCRQTLKVKRYSCYMAAVVVEGAWTSSQDGDVTFKALEQCFKARNFTTGSVEVLVEP